MAWTALFLAACAALAALPLLPALREWRLRRDAAPLRVVREHDGNPMHFALGLRAFVERSFATDLAALAPGEARHGRLADGTPYTLLGPGAGFAPSADEARSARVNRVLVATGDLALGEGVLFEGDAYARGDLACGDGAAARALLAERDLQVGSGASVLRWAHAGRALRVGREVSAPGRLTAGQSVTLGPATAFGRVHAPVVRFGDGSEPLAAEAPPRPAPVRRPRQVVKRALHLERGPHEGDLVVFGPLRLGPGAHVAGSVKCRGALRLDPEARVDGALVAAGPLSIGERCAVGGPVVSEEAVHLGAGARIGSPARLTSVSAPRIFVARGATVHGTVWAREAGQVNP